MHLARVELVGLSRLATKDEHISVVQLDTGHRLGSHELSIVDFELCPLLAGNRRSKVTTVLVALEERRCARIKLVDEQMIGNLRFTIGARHHIDPALIHDNSSSVDRIVRQGGDVKPKVRVRIVTLTSLSRRRPPTKTSQRQYEPVSYQRERSIEPTCFHWLFVVCRHIGIDLEHVRKCSRTSCRRFLAANHVNTCICRLHCCHLSWNLASTTVKSDLLFDEALEFKVEEEDVVGVRSQVIDTVLVLVSIA